MKILINAIRLNSAGGLRVGENLLKGFESVKRENDEIIFLCSESKYSQTYTVNVRKEYIPQNNLKTIYWLTGQKWIRKQLKRFRPDIVFNLCNTPIKTSIPQLLLIHWSYAVFNQDYIWKKMPWKDYLKRKIRLYLIKKSYKYVNHLTVQIEAMKKEGEKNFLGNRDITVIPSSFDLKINNEIDQDKFDNRVKKFLFLSSYYYHKNHQALIEVAKLVKEKNLDYQIQITIDKNNSSAKDFLLNIEKHGLQEQLVNLGSIQPNKIDEAFEQAYATVNPSFLESFGLTYLEAASRGKLILASDLDFVHETMKDAAIYFNTFDAKSILNAMHQSTDKKLYLEKIERGREIVESWPSWIDVTKQYYNLMNEILEKKKLK